MRSLHLSRSGLRLLLPLLPALATLLLLALVLWANQRLVQRDLTERAEFRVQQQAQVFADQLSRMLAQRASELELTADILLLRPIGTETAARELARLMQQSSAYGWIGWVDPDGGLHAAATPQPRPGQPVLPPEIASQRVPFLLPPSALAPARLPAASQALTALLVPVGRDDGPSRGMLVALLQRDYIEGMRQFALGDAQGRRSLDLTLLDRDGQRLLGPPDGRGLIAATVPLRAVDSPLPLHWQARASQPMAAATRPATLLQDSLLGWGLPAALLIGAAGLWFSRRLAQPYRAVLDAATVSTPAAADGPPVPGAFLGAVADALRQLAPAWRLDDGTRALLEHMIQDAQRLQQVLDQLPTPVYLLDPDERVSFWNRQAEAVFGWTAAEAMGRPIDALLPGQVHADRHEAADGQPSAFEACTHTRDGDERWGEWRLLPLRAPDGQPQGQIVLVRDITDRVRAAASMARHQDELADLNQRLMEQEQATSRRLAQTLHDQLGQTLGAVRLTYDSLQPLWHTASEPRHRERAARLGSLIDQAIAEVRQALIELRPPLLEEMGLASALDNELQMRRTEAAPAELTLGTGERAAHTRWPANVEHAAFMVAREAVANAIRHAGARHIRLQLDGQPEQLTLHIEDDGCGMPAGERPLPGHLGLVGMRERALAIGARLQVAPAQPQGLRVSLHWPAQPPRPDTLGETRP